MLVTRQFNSKQIKSVSELYGTERTKNKTNLEKEGGSKLMQCKIQITYYDDLIKYVDSKALTAQPEGGFVWFRTANQDYRNWYIVVKQFHPSYGFADIFVKSYNMRDKWEL